jgi:hypothetical protein
MLLFFIQKEINSGNSKGYSIPFQTQSYLNYRRAESQGGFFNKEIGRKYKYKKLTK